jgi:hypothetical protein
MIELNTNSLDFASDYSKSIGKEGHVIIVSNTNNGTVKFYV